MEKRQSALAGPSLQWRGRRGPVAGGSSGRAAGRVPHARRGPWTDPGRGRDPGKAPSRRRQTLHSRTGQRLRAVIHGDQPHPRPWFAGFFDGHPCLAEVGKAQHAALARGLGDLHAPGAAVGPCAQGRVGTRHCTPGPPAMLSADRQKTRPFPVSCSAKSSAAPSAPPRPPMPPPEARTSPCPGATSAASLAESLLSGCVVCSTNDRSGVSWGWIRTAIAAAREGTPAAARLSTARRLNSDAHTARTPRCTASAQPTSMPGTESYSPAPVVLFYGGVVGKWKGLASGRHREQATRRRREQATRRRSSRSAAAASPAQQDGRVRSSRPGSKHSRTHHSIQPGLRRWRMIAR